LESSNNTGSGRGTGARHGQLTRIQRWVIASPSAGWTRGHARASRIVGKAHAVVREMVAVRRSKQRHAVVDVHRVRQHCCGPILREHRELGARCITLNKQRAIRGSSSKRSTTRAHPVGRIRECAVGNERPSGNGDRSWRHRVNNAVRAVILYWPPSGRTQILAEVIARNAPGQELEGGVDLSRQLGEIQPNHRRGLNVARSVEALMIHVVGETPQRSGAVKAVLKRQDRVAHHRVQSWNVLVLELGGVTPRVVHVPWNEGAPRKLSPHVSRDGGLQLQGDQLIGLAVGVSKADGATS